MFHVSITQKEVVGMACDYQALGKAFLQGKAYGDALTVDSPENVPGLVIPVEDRFFTWDNEKRAASKGHPYLYSWSYYTGVVMEGLLKLGEALGQPRYSAYVEAYLRAQITGDALNCWAGYVPYHGLDCYKTAALLPWFPADAAFSRIAADLYRDLTETNARYTEEALGGNYWHCWLGGTPPRYKVWLDGLYMAQPFLARQASLRQDRRELERIARRFFWVHANLMNQKTGLLYHAGNGQADVCPFHWLRAMGWYMMAQVDVASYLYPDDREALSQQFRQQADALLRWADPATGLWANLTGMPVTATNRLETSGSAMMIYALLKAVRTGFLDDAKGRYTACACKAYTALVHDKLTGGRLRDIYLMASASGENNYENPDCYLCDEGKGVGPFLMATAEIANLLG